MFRPLLPLAAFAIIAAGDPASVPSFDPIVSAAGYGLTWTAGADNTLRWPDTWPAWIDHRVVPFGRTFPGPHPTTALRVLLLGSPTSWMGLLCTDGRDMASCGDARLYAQRCGWDCSPTALARRLRNPPPGAPTRMAVERMIALRLLQASQSAPAILPGDADPFLSAAGAGFRPALADPADALAAVAAHSDLVVVITPSASPAPPGGCGMGRTMSTLGSLANLTGKSDVEILATFAWDIDSAAIWPIECAARYGNCRLDRIIWSMALPGPGADLACDVQVTGAGLAALGRAAAENGFTIDAAQRLVAGTFTLAARDDLVTLRSGAAPTARVMVAADARGHGLDTRTVCWAAARWRALRAAGMASGPLAGLPLVDDDLVVFRWGSEGAGTRFSLEVPSLCGEPLRNLIAMGLAMAKAATAQPPRGASQTRASCSHGSA